MRADYAHMHQLEIGDVVAHDYALPTRTDQLWPVRRGRPWEPLHMTTTLWQALEPRVVLLSDLVATQDQLDPATMRAGVETSFCGDPYPHVVRWQGLLHIVDGHNRLSMRKLRGDLAAAVRLLKL